MHFRTFAGALVCLLVLSYQAGATDDKAILKTAPEVKSEPRAGFAGSYLAGRMASGYKDLDASATYLKKALNLDPKNSDLQARTFEVLVGSGRMAEALDLAPELLQQKNAGKLVQLVSAIDAFKHRQYKKVIQLTDAPERGDVTNITDGLLQAWALYGLGETKTAISLLDRLKGPDWVGIFRDYHAGLILSLANDKEESGLRLARTYKADKALPISRAQAVYLARAGKRDEALKVVQDFLKQAPNNSLMLRLGEDIEASRNVPPLVNDAVQGASEVMFQLGAELARNNGDELAAIYLQLALYLDDKNALNLLALADLYDQLKQPAKVIETLRRVPGDSNLKPVAELQLAIVLDSQEQTEESFKHLDAVIAANPSNLEALVTKGNILRVRKRFAEAQTYYEKAIQLVPKPEQKHWTLFFYRGITYERAKQWPKAEADLKKALELQPDQPTVLNYLGYSWIDRSMNLEEGMAMLKRAVQQNPNDGYTIDSVGWAYYRMGQYDDAVSWVQRAVAKKPSDPVLNDHLGDVYWKVGRKLEAYFQWRQAKDLKPEPDDLARIEQKLKNGFIDDKAQPPPSVGLNNQPPQTDKN